MTKRLSDLDRVSDVDLLVDHLIEEMADPPLAGVDDPKIEFHSSNEIYLKLETPEYSNTMRAMDLTELPDPWAARHIWQNSDELIMSIVKD